MAGPYDGIHPNYLLIGVAILGSAFWGLVRWICDAPSTPNPWGAEFEKSLEEPDLVPTCHRCSTPHHPTAWFCEHCGSAVGPYNNLMPYLNVFSQGEVFRNGVTDRIRIGPLTLIGYLLVSLHGYVVFAPVYWFFLLKNLFFTRGDRAETVEGETV